MDLFKSYFSVYPAETGEFEFIAKEGSSYFFKGNLPYNKFRMTHKANQDFQRFYELGLIRFVNDSRSPKEIKQDIIMNEHNNPIKYLGIVSLELTGLCTLNCGHCYRGGSKEDEYGLSVAEIKKALEPLLRAGIKGMNITGGESTLREDDLFEIIDYVSPFLVSEDVGNEKSKKPQLPIGILTNGYFENQIGFVRKIKSYSNVGIQISLDCYEEEKVDRNRSKDVFAKVKNLAQICKEEELFFRVSMLCDHEFINRDRMLNHEFTEEERNNIEYFHAKGAELTVGSIVQLGNAAQRNSKPVIESQNNYFGALSSSKKHHDGWCKGFTRPNILHIRPNGSVGNCSYAYGFPEEFGNLKLSSMEEIVNGIQNTRVYQMFKDGSIEKYQHELDKSLFQRTFTGSCEVVILSVAYGLTKERLMRQGVANPVQMANEKVARTYKFIN